MTYESWIKKALEQAVNPDLANSLAHPAHGAVYLVGCTINIVAGSQSGSDLPAAPFAIDAKLSAMQAAKRPVKASDTHQAE